MSESLFRSESYAPPAQVEYPNPQTPSVVVGGPRSGKTDSLRRLASDITAKQDPDRVLIITPSRLAASRLRDLVSIDCSVASAKPRARSITSFAFETLQSQGIKLLSGASQERLLADLVSQAIENQAGARWGIDRETLKLQGFIQELRDLLGVIIESSLSDQQLTKLQKDFPQLKLQVAIDLLPMYRNKLEQNNLLDPAQLSIAAIDAYQRDTFSHILVDDAHNLTAGQLRLVAKVMESAKGYLFGDPDLSTLGFRGSNSGSFIELARANQMAELAIQKPAGNPQLDQLLARISSRIPLSLFSEHRMKPSEANAITGFVFSSVVEETDWLAIELRKRNLAGVDFSDMAVIGRTRVQLEQLARELSSRKVPVRIIGAQRSLSDQPMARAILDLIAVALGKPDLTQLEQLLLSPLVGLDSIELRELRRITIPIRQQGKNQAEAFLEVLGQSEPPKFLSSLSAALRRLRETENLSCHQAVSIGWEIKKKQAEAGRLSDSELDSALELFAAAQRFDDRKEGGPLEFALRQLTRNIPEDSLAPISQKPAVTLTTAAQLIRSYQVVAVPRLQEGIWPNLNPRNALLGAGSLQSFLLGRTASPLIPARSELADELRMFYRAVGSCESDLLLSAMADEVEQPSQFFVMGKIDLAEAKPADFDLRRMVGKLRRALIDGDSSAAPMLAALALAGAPGAHPDSWQGLRELSTDEPLNRIGNKANASKLEDFETCPLHWFISSFASDSVGFQASLGILLHAALENSDITSPTDFVEQNWQEIEFDSALTERRVKKDALVMAKLVEKYLSESNDLVSAEQGFELEISGLTISGKIDRIEKVGGGSIAVDLKTSKTALSKDKAAKNRQLAIYQLAIEQDDTAAGGKLVFVGGGKIQEREQPAMNEELRQEITLLAEGLKSQLAQGELLAKYDEHCSKDGSCQLLLGRVITDG